MTKGESPEKVLTASDLKKKIASANDIKLEEMKISEWDTTIWVSALTYKERNQALEGANISSSPEGVVTPDQIENFTMAVIIRGVRDRDGSRVFGEDDVPMLRERNSSVIDRISARITNLSGFGVGFAEQTKARFPK